MNNNSAHQPDPGMGLYRKRFSLRHGIETWFDLDRDTVVSVWLSSWSGREVISINGQVIISKRQITWSSRHNFTHAGQPYSIVVKHERWLKMRIELWKGDVLVDFDIFTDGEVFSRGLVHDKKRQPRALLINTLAGMVLGILGMAFGLWLGRLFGG